jgi:hypothetical protein
MNAVAKGTRNEKKCEDHFKSLGYKTWRTFRCRYRNLDFLGLFDVVVLAKDGSHMIFIQVKSNKCDRKVIREIDALRMPPFCRKQIWVWVDRIGFKVIYS